MRNGKRQEVDICDLSRTRQATSVHHGIIKQTDVIGNKSVIVGGNRRTQSLDSFGDAQPVRIGGLGEDADAPVLRQGARGPSLVNVADEPIGYRNVVGVVLVKQSDQHITSSNALNGSDPQLFAQLVDQIVCDGGAASRYRIEAVEV